MSRAYRVVIKGSRIMAGHAEKRELVFSAGPVQ